MRSPLIPKDSLFFVYLKCLSIIIFIIPFVSVFYQFFFQIRLRKFVWKFTFDISIGIFKAKFGTFINFYVTVVAIQQVDTLFCQTGMEVYFLFFSIINIFFLLGLKLFSKAIVSCSQKASYFENFSLTVES